MTPTTTNTPQEAAQNWLDTKFQIPNSELRNPDQAPKLPDEFGSKAAEAPKPAQAQPPVATGGIIPAQPIPQQEAQPQLQAVAQQQPAQAQPVDPATSAAEIARFQAEEKQRIANETIQHQNVAEDINRLKEIEAEQERQRKQQVAPIQAPTEPAPPPPPVAPAPAPQADTVIPPQALATPTEGVAPPPQAVAAPQETAQPTATAPAAQVQPQPAKVEPQPQIPSAPAPPVQAEAAPQPVEAPVKQETAPVKEAVPLDPGPTTVVTEPLPQFVPQTPASPTGIDTPDARLDEEVIPTNVKPLDTLRELDHTVKGLPVKLEATLGASI